MRCIVFFLLFASIQLPAYAIDGQLDASFANGGRTTVAPASGYNSARSVAEMSDGRLVVAGDCASGPCLARLNPDGSLDTTYGPLHTGTASFSQFSGAPSHSVQSDMILLADGRAVLAGCGESDKTEGPPTLFVVRADGSDFDTSLGNGSGFFVGTQGAATANGCATRVRQQKDGKFVVLQNAFDSVYGGYVLVTRITADVGALDSTFGSAGQAKIAFSVNGPTGNDDSATSLELQANGAIVTGGFGTSGNGTKVMEFARLLSNGQLDGSFGNSGNGRFFHSAGSAIDTLVFDIAITPDQRIVFGGEYLNISDASNDFEMAGRLTSAGILDTAFAGGFVVHSAANGATGESRIQRVAATADSLIALAAIPRSDGSDLEYFEITRFDRAGNKVSTFGGNGSVYASFAADDQDDRAAAQVLTTRGLVAAGTSFSSTTGDPSFGVARLQYEHIFSDSFQ